MKYRHLAGLLGGRDTMFQPGLICRVAAPSRVT